MRIGIVAPARGIDPASADRVRQQASDRAELLFHPQCFLSDGHFAGPDAARADALVAVANDPAIDAIWFARGGYGSIRLMPAVLPRLGPAAVAKRWLGYSDTGTLLAALHRAGARVAHGPMVADIRRVGGNAAIDRALDFLVDDAASACEPTLGGPAFAFNLTILGHLVGTPYLPDMWGAELLIEEIAEPIYRIDRIFGQLHAAGVLAGLRGLRLGRISDIPPNDPDFGADEQAVTRHWCAAAGIPYLGRADIGHDADNKVVPFGLLR
ncbi:muramoyltetrapeptide carboxypeptidase [Sphingomonas jejuensis]|uniref:Muramoyltetrapeptide carboxypeptidase n=1 Tax=Sphingomonas jejuensis TaxID=904715 RepID=A0ABX0XLJ8_9SPHN|nr:LD-carboxypeptidase [Sphingomonas jejuensis]NJC33662.1 muramoyltetrapeptide carboxypeptidase [Sphingomonas jejuensis]